MSGIRLYTNLIY